MIEVDEPIVVTPEDLAEMGDKPAAGISSLIENYSEVTLPADAEIDPETHILVGE